MRRSLSQLLVLATVLATALAGLVILSPAASAATRVIDTPQACTAAGGEATVQPGNRQICTLRGRVQVAAGDELVLGGPAITQFQLPDGLTNAGRLEVRSGTIADGFDSSGVVLIGTGAGLVVTATGSNSGSIVTQDVLRVVTAGGAATFTNTASGTIQARAGGRLLNDAAFTFVNNGVVALCPGTFTGNGGSGTYQGTRPVDADCTVPTVVVEKAVDQQDPATRFPLRFTVTFSEPVTGFTAGDVVVTGEAGAQRPAVSGTGPTYTVTVPGVTRAGDVTVAVPAGAAADAAGNASTASTSTDATIDLVPSLSGVVAVDNDRDGQIDFDEPRLSGVVLTLSRDGSAPRSATTGADGTYAFLDVPAGQWTLTQTQPGGVDNGSPDTVAVTVRDGVEQRVDFTELPRPVAIDTTSADSSQIPAGGTVTMSATGLDAQGRPTGDITDRTTFATTTPGASCTGNRCTATRVGSFTITATFNGTRGPDTSVQVVAGPAASLTAVSGGGQSAQAGTTYGAPLVAVVRDAQGNPAPGVEVVFALPATGTGRATFPGGATTATVATAADGTATSPVITATAAGTLTATASTAGVAGSASYPLTVQPAGSISGRVVVDRDRNGVADVGEAGLAGVTISLSGPSGPLTTTTDAAGVFAFRVLRTGAYTITETQPAGFDEGSASTATRTVAVGQDVTDVVFTELPRPVAIDTVTASPAAIVAGGSTTLTATGRDAGGGSAGDVTARTVFATSTPGASCTGNVCTATRAGSFVVTSSFEGVPGPSTTVVVAPAAPASVVAVSGGGTTVVDTAFAAPLVALVTDALGNPVPGRDVVFVLPAQARFAGGASSATVSTGADGRAISPAVVAVAVGSGTATASVPGVGSASYGVVVAPAVADLGVRFAARQPDWAVRGSVVRVDLTTANAGPSATRATTVLRLPRGWKVRRASDGSTREGRRVTTTADLAPGGRDRSFVVVQVGRSRTPLVARVSGTVADPVPANDSDTPRPRLRNRQGR